MDPRSSTNETADAQPRACSYGEIRVAEELADRLGESGREVLWRPVWVRTEPELAFALVAVVASVLGLLAIGDPVPWGIAIALLLALWSLEVGRLPSPLSLLRPERATQDVLAADPKGRTGVKSVLLIVRADVPRRPSRPVARICTRGGELAWLVIAATLLVVALRALEWNPGALDVVQLFPALGSLILLACALAARSAPLAEARPDWTGIDQALAAAAELDSHPDDPRRCDIVVAGATGIGGSARVLNADSGAGAACNCWQFRTGEAVVAEVRRSAG